MLTTLMDFDEDDEMSLIIEKSWIASTASAVFWWENRMKATRDYHSSGIWYNGKFIDLSDPFLQRTAGDEEVYPDNARFPVFKYGLKTIFDGAYQFGIRRDGDRLISGWFDSLPGVIVQYELTFEKVSDASLNRILKLYELWSEV